MSVFFRVPLRFNGFFIVLIPWVGVAFLTCSPPRPVVPAPPPAPVLVSSGGPRPSPPALPRTAVVPETIPVKPSADRSGFLPVLARSLRQLAAGDRAEHVRIVWLGDSHTAADLWTGAFRRRLQARFGNGGPGFVHVGWSPMTYRHEGVRLGVSGRWRLEPRAYAQTQRSGDGVFGLGGVRTVALGIDSQATLKLTDTLLVNAELRWDIAYRAPSNYRILLRWNGPQGTVTRTLTGGPVDTPLSNEISAGDIHHVVVTQAAETLTIHHDSHDSHDSHYGAEYVGVVVEGARPGVVVDTLGLNGARLATALAWDENSWSSELARRRPDLFVVAFGTNESQDRTAHPERYGDQLDALLDRVRAASATAECLVITPIDRTNPDAQVRLAAFRTVVTARAERRGCFVWSALDAMGGPNAMAVWQRESPARAAPDGVHLTGYGYRFLGERLAEDVLRAVDGKD